MGSGRTKRARDRRHAPSTSEERVRGRAQNLTPPRAVAWLAAAAVAIAVLGALAAFLVDEEAFDSFWNALWWSIVTVGTVGYGDFVPTNPGGRIVAAVMILAAMAFFPLLIGYVTATVVGRIQRDRDEALGNERMAHAAEVLQRLEAIDDRLKRLEERSR